LRRSRPGDAAQRHRYFSPSDLDEALWALRNISLQFKRQHRAGIGDRVHHNAKVVLRRPRIMRLPFFYQAVFCGRWLPFFFAALGGE
jgi:hypothetical protein